MQRIEDNILRAVEFPFFHAVSTRSAGSMRDTALRDAFCVQAGMDPRALTTADQVHGTRIAVVDRAAAGTRIARTDALMTSEAGIPLGIFTADCLPVLLADVRGRAVAAVHAGWRGLAAGIITEAVRRMEYVFGVAGSDIAVLIGPHICGACYEVGDEVRAAFNRPHREDRFDLAAEAQRQLRACGVEAITASPYCTYHDNDHFFSYRRGQTAERIISVIALKQSQGEG
jgi:YfiH family protein